MEQTFSRKDFFRAGLVKAGEGLFRLFGDVAPPRPAPPRAPVIRPPGALEEPEFLKACTRCSDCIQACEPMVIRKAGPEVGLRATGTPLIMPKENPCRMCDGFPCIAACGTGALRMPGGAIGVAVVNAAACYMTMRQPCDYCEKACPEEGAVLLGDPGATPRIQSEACTGCGECAQLCPADAITIERR